MEEKLAFLFSKILQLGPNEDSNVNSELHSLYSEVDTLVALFTLFQPKYPKEIRTLSGCAIKTTLKNVLNLLTNSDLSTIKQLFLNIFQSEHDLETLNIVIDGASIIFYQWPEIFDFLQLLINEDLNESYQLAMAILSKIPEELYNKSTEKFIEMCTKLITFSLDQQTNCRAALALFSSISHFIPISNSLSQSFPNFYIKFLELFQEYLIINDSYSYIIASQLEKSIESIEIEDTSTLFNFLIELGKQSEIKSHYKIAILNVINSILKKQVIPDLFESILQIAIECSSSLFDNYCYIENEASLVSFHFLNYFNSIENFESILIKNLRTTSQSTIFASLSALSSLLTENDTTTSPISDTFLSFILSSCEIQNHSILELSFSIFLNIDYDFVSEEMKNKIIIVTLNCCMQASGHSELQEIIMKLIAYFLFNGEISDEISDDVFSMLLALYNQEVSISVRDKVILCFAGMTNSFSSEKVEKMLSLFVPLLIDSAKSFNSQCVRSQAAAVESLSFCISKYPQHFTDFVVPFVSFLMTWIEEINDRQHVESSIYSLQKLIFSENLNNIEILNKILLTVIKYVNQNESGQTNLGIDDSGISIEEIQILSLSLIRKLAKFLFLKRKVEIDVGFFISSLPNLVSAICKFATSNVNCQKYAIKTIVSVCQCCYRTEPTVVFAFCEFFLNCFENNLYLALSFFESIFNSNIQVSYPDEFFQSIYPRCLHMLSEGNNQIILLFEIMSNRFNIFPIDQFIELVVGSSTKLSGDDTSRIVSIFYNYMNHNVITQENSSAVDAIMSISFNALHFCTNYSIKPSPIRLLSLLISFSIDFNDQIISQFYPIFTQIFNNNTNPNLQTKYLNETICESISFLLKVIVSLPKVNFPFELFFPKLFYFLPFTENFSCNSELLLYLSKLPTSPHFAKLSPYFDDLFSCLIRIISLDDDTIYAAGIETKPFSSAAKLASEMLRAQESRIEIIKEVAIGDQEKIEYILNRLSNFSRDPDFLQI